MALLIENIIKMLRKKRSFRQNQSESCAFSVVYFYFDIKLHKKTPLKQKSPILLHKRNGEPGTATEMLPNYIYKQGLKFFDAGYTAALAVMFVLIMTVVTLIFLKLRKFVEEKVA